MSYKNLSYPFILRDAFQVLAKDPATKAAILTGADPYYCAGKVN
jgi:enoyl-CoA hydratase/carnithine racemase